MPYKTRQKTAIWRIIEASQRPLTAHEICKRARKEVKGLGIATVYRALRQLVDEGQTRHIELPGAQPHYESAARHHHHFFLCQKCEKLFDLMGCLRGISNLLPEGYQMKGHEIVIYGECSRCAEGAA
jgi:Fur family ferric uptake transcriptional regulator